MGLTTEVLQAKSSAYTGSSSAQAINARLYSDIRDDQIAPYLPLVYIVKATNN